MAAAAAGGVGDRWRPEESGTDSSGGGWTRWGRMAVAAAAEGAGDK